MLFIVIGTIQLLFCLISLIENLFVEGRNLESTRSWLNVWMNPEFNFDKQKRFFFSFLGTLLMCLCWQQRRQLDNLISIKMSQKPESRLRRWPWSPSFWGYCPLSFSLSLRGGQDAHLFYRKKNPVKQFCRRWGLIQLGDSRLILNPSSGIKTRVVWGWTRNVECRQEGIKGTRKEKSYEKPLKKRKSN